MPGALSIRPMRTAQLKAASSDRRWLASVVGFIPSSISDAWNLLITLASIDDSSFGETTRARWLKADSAASSVRGANVDSRSRVYRSWNSAHSSRLGLLYLPSRSSASHFAATRSASRFREVPVDRATCFPLIGSVYRIIRFARSANLTT
ncbi:MAG: hypothetical protein C0485_13935 [Pirellula sp.]|nr:hypothetical protein [Pirellula sp.]